MDIIYNKVMSRIAMCIKCNQISAIYALDLCSKCYFKKNNQLPKTKERKRIYQKNYYQKNKEKCLSYSRKYSKTEKYKDIKKRYDKKHRDDIRFDGNREKVLRRDNYQCQECGTKDNLLVHHDDGKSARKNSAEVNNELSNLITLCNSCHMKKHGGKDRNPCKKFWDLVSKAVRMSMPELEELAEKMKDSID